MKIIRIENKGVKRTYATEEGETYLIENALDYLLGRNKKVTPVKEVNSDTNSLISENSGERILVPFDPPEIWGSGISYAVSKRRYTEKDIARIGDKSIYERVYDAERPEIFFKGTSRCTVGQNSRIRVRRDSNWTLPEPELAVILDHNGKILAFTIFDDVSARDIEAENPLYLPESKIYNGSSAFGPFLVTPDEFGDPYSKGIKMRIFRNGKVFFEESSSTSQMRVKIEKQIHYLMIDNSIPDGTILTTGTCIVPGRDEGLKSGDTVEISIDGIGTLTNEVEKQMEPLASK